VRSFPRVPEASFLLFRALAYEALPKAQFELVDAAWSEGLSATRAWIERQETAEEEAVAAFLRELIGKCTTRDEMVTRLRGAQVAYFLADCLLLINERQLNARAEQAPSAISDEDIDVLRENQSPRTASLAVLGALSGAGGTALAGVTLADVAVDGSSAVVAGRRVRVPVRAQPVLRAQRLWLRMAGVVDDAQPFLGTGPGHRPSEKKLQDTLVRLTGETGLLLAGRYTRHAKEDDAHWIRRYGVSVQLLQQEPRNPDGFGGGLL